MLKPCDVQWCGRVFLDEQFHTFFYEGNYYKAVLGNAAGWPRKPGAQFFIKAMSSEGFIPETELTNLKIEGFADIYRQHTENYSIPLMYASCEALRESALLFLNFNKWLFKKGYALLDGHCNNTIFQKAMLAKWCDIGSVVSLDSHTPMVGFDEFVRHHLYPLLLRQKSPSLGEFSRLGTRRGISHEAGAALFDAGLRLPAERGAVLEALIEFIESMEFSLGDTAWSDYYGDGDVELIIDERKQGIGGGRGRMFTRLFRALSPTTVIDIGANAGLFSRFMAAHGAEVLAVEPDESAVVKHHRVLRKHGFSHSIKLMVAGIGEPVFVGEMAVALALTHHLFFTMRYPWKYIVDLLASYTSDILLTEFMPHGMYGSKQPEYLPPHYRIEVFAGHLERYFHQVELIDYPRLPDESPRIFLLCHGKRATPIDDGMGGLPWDKPYMTKNCDPKKRLV